MEPDENPGGQDNQTPVEFGTEKTTKKIEVKKEDVTGQNIFKLAKRILLFCAIIFVVIATLRAILDDNKGINEVGDYRRSF
jgi:hypothetical protein